MSDYSRVHESSISCKNTDCKKTIDIVIASYHGVGKKCPHYNYVNRVGIDYDDSSTTLSNKGDAKN